MAGLGSLVRSEPCSEHWAGPEWRVEAERWIRSTLDGLGVSVTGAMEQQRLRPWSTQLTVATDVGHVWFKENCPGQWFEAGLLAALAELVPDAVVAPLAVEPERGWFLTPDHGATLTDRSADVDLWARLRPLGGRPAPPPAARRQADGDRDDDRRPRRRRLVRGGPGRRERRAPARRHGPPPRG